MLTIEDIKSTIIKYILDERKTQAVLLDGEWGCGKTFFIKEHLIPALEKLENANIYFISLYGIASIDNIQDMIYAQWLGLCAEKKIIKRKAIAQPATKSLYVFGKSAVQAVENKLGIKQNIEGLLKSAVNYNIRKNGRAIIIFDDLERCRVDIIQLMGFLNNLSENNGFKVILIANEKEINKLETATEEALKYLVAIKIKEITNDKANPSSDLLDGVISNEIRNISTRMFGEVSLYERTREKLIGLTVPYCITVSEVFETVVKKYIKDTSLQNRVIENKDDIISILDVKDHRNLRTLINACIAIEDILTNVDTGLLAEKDMLNAELNKVILYAVYSAIRRSLGKTMLNWSSNVRCNMVDDNALENPINGYAFVDEYWRKQSVDKHIVTKDLGDRIDYLCKVEQQQRSLQEHENLALFKLDKWYLLNDEDVKMLIQKMKRELKDKKYQPYEFKSIILTLMRINNPNYGMTYEINEKNDDGAVYESTEASQFVGMSYVDPEPIKHNYIDWDRVDIDEFIQLMVSYFDNEKFTLTKEMICVFSEDKQLVYYYRLLTMPLLNLIENHSFHSVLTTEDDIPISDIPWDSTLLTICRNKREDYLNLGKFISLFDYTKLTEHILKANSNEIHNFCEALKRVYSFSNLGDFYSSDLDMLNKIINFISEKNGVEINPERSRTKEIAFRRLIVDLQKYKNMIM